MTATRSKLILMSLRGFVDPMSLLAMPVYFIEVAYALALH
jgi:hypothetical protein